MADWFVYQRDVYPNDMDPDALGTMLVPDYDAQGQIVYCDAATSAMNGVRRVRTRWGLNPHMVQYDLVVHATTPQNTPAGTPVVHGHAATPHSNTQPPTVQTVQWWPKKEVFRFVDMSSGFRFENHTQRLCLCVTRDAHGQHHATLHRLGVNHECLEAVGLVVGIRVHELALFSPGGEGWFARFATTTTRSSHRVSDERMQSAREGYDGPPRPMLV